MGTLDCGSQRLAASPEQELAPGEPMPLLSEVFDPVRAYEARQVTLDIETEVASGAPQETAPRERSVQVTAGLVHAARMQRQATTPELAERGFTLPRSHGLRQPGRR